MSRNSKLAKSAGIVHSGEQRRRIMGASSVGRNDPCPCGSGSKYKKCCLSRDPQAGSGGGHTARAAAPEPEHHDHARAGAVRLPAGMSPAQVRQYVERLDRWANTARDALDGGRLQEAESLADRLRAEYPDQIDGYEIGGQVCVRQGRWAEAAERFERALALALRHPNDYDEEIIQELRQQAEQARVQAQGRTRKP